ncbi:uncharacterized protein K02A2.6-like [Saccostrea cucullata]|uniref:uncharacterized protein K02A2.6-like n=1 Tax=Saccostrea cuccullata TaxID=36930 RepID=UPI002ED29F38
MGKECYRIYRHLDISEQDRKKTKTILEAMRKHFEPQVNVIYERYIFNTTEQKQGETLDQYVTKLRQLADSCEFGSLTDDMIRDRLVLGIDDNPTRARMLREPKLDLKKAISMCRASEVAQQQLKKIESEGTKENVHYSSRKPEKPRKFDSKKPNASKCKYCGGNHARDKTACPAYGKKCSKCDKMNHFAKVCKQTSRSYSKKTDNRASERKPGRRRVHLVGEDNSDSEDDTYSEDSAFKVTHSIGSVQSLGKQWFVNMKMKLAEQKNVTEMKCQIDTGSTCNLISYKDFCAIAQYGDPPMQKSNSKLTLYDGSRMKPLGQAIVNCEQNGKQYKLEFQIVDVKQYPLLSAEACDKMKIIQLSENVHSVTGKEKHKELTKEYILAEYKDVFTGLGCLPGEYHLEIDKSVTPLQHSPRRVAAPLKRALKDKIQELEKLGVIAKVTQPTEWISSMVAVKKPNKLRICIDPKDLNKALKRSHYPMPTIEEILPRLSKAKVFSVLDAKDGFWQIKLDKERSFLTTFWTPFGRYRRIRMPFGISTAPEEYQRRQHYALNGLKGVDVIVDDILVFGCGDSEEEAKRSKRVLDLQRRNYYSERPSFQRLQNYYSKTT